MLTYSCGDRIHRRRFVSTRSAKAGEKGLEALRRKDREAQKEIAKQAGMSVFVALFAATVSFTPGYTASALRLESHFSSQCSLGRPGDARSKRFWRCILGVNDRYSILMWSLTQFGLMGKRGFEHVVGTYVVAANRRKVESRVKKPPKEPQHARDVASRPREQKKNGPLRIKSIQGAGDRFDKTEDRTAGFDT